MLRSIKALQNYALTTAEGEAGQVADFYFDDKAWVIRYLVADLSEWQPGRQVFISPVALGQPDWERGAFPLLLNRARVAQSPTIETNQPISRQQEANLHKYYNWPVYWLGEGSLPPPVVEGASDEAAAAEVVTTYDHHLRRVREVIGYNLKAKDGEMGRVEDFIVNDETWAIGYMVVEIPSGLAHRKVLVSPNWVEKVSPAEAKVYIDLRSETIKNSPEYDPAEPVNQDYETRLYDYYGRPQ
jgi:hypothetical protein